MPTKTPGLVFGNPSFAGHEQIVFCHDGATSLRAIIAIHDTTLGAGHGGTRMWAYASEDEALTDALRLSEGMTYKCALANLPAGGAKGVIIGDARSQRSPDLLRAYGRHIERLAGGFITGEDVGMSVADMDILAEVAPRFVRGTSGRAVTDPSPHTALGVFAGIEAAVKQRLNRDDLKGVRVCIQGLGHVGMRLAKLLHEAGARLVVSDLRPEALQHLESAFEAAIVAPERAHAAEVDVFAPCALGAVLNARTIPEIRASVIAGAANNQLERPEDGKALSERGILYAPDYAINAGGIIALVMPELDADGLERELLAIGGTLTAIFKRAEADRLPTSMIADMIAREKLAAAREAGA